MKTLLTGPLAAVAQLGYTKNNYVGFTSPFVLTPAPGRTDMDIYTAGLQILCKLGPQWTADVFYNYTSMQTNQAVFDANRSMFGMGLRYDF